MKNITVGVVAAMFLFVALPAAAISETDRGENDKQTTKTEVKTTAVQKTAVESEVRAALIVRIKELLAQLQKLQNEIKTVHEEIRASLSGSLKEGMTHQDIREIQKLLATDPAIYPEGLETGYYGRLTKEALKRFQVKHELKVTGEVDAETRALLEEYLAEKFGDDIPKGLLTAPGIQKKVEMRVEKKCEDKAGMGPLCVKFKVHQDKDKGDGDKTDKGDLAIEVRVNDDTALADVFYGSKLQYTATMPFSSEEAIIDYFVEHKNFSRDDVKAAIDFEYEDEDDN